MSELTTDHYRMLLGLDEDWSVDSVTFDPSGKRVVINISFAGSKRMCASCSELCPQADLAPERPEHNSTRLTFYGDSSS